MNKNPYNDAPTQNDELIAQQGLRLQRAFIRILDNEEREKIIVAAELAARSASGPK